MANGTNISHGARPDRDTSAWVGWVYFAAFLLILNGAFQTIMGILAIFSGQIYTVTNDSVILFNLAGWGFVHILFGILLISAGSALFNGQLWARIFAVIMATLGVISQLMFISAYPFWSIIAIVVNLAIIYALTVHGPEETTFDEARQE